MVDPNRGPVTRSDANGHYSLVIDISQWRAVAAACGLEDRVGAVHEERRISFLPYVHTPVIERNLYVGRKRQHRSCAPIARPALVEEVR